MTPSLVSGYSSSQCASSVTRNNIQVLEQQLEIEKQERLQAEKALQNTAKELAMLEDMLANVR